MIDKIIQEYREHEILLERGVKFEIEYKKCVNIPYLRGFLPRKATKTICLHQPTLATLSAIGREFLLFDIRDKSELDKPFSEAVILADKTAEKMARVIAIMATGIKDPEIKNQDKQDKEITDLATLIFHNVKPVMLLKIVQAVRMMCSLENFITSISLMSEIKAGLPTLIEREG